MATPGTPDGATTATATPAELAAAATSTIGGRVGRYVLLRELGAGGMGTVWEAYDPQLDRRLALKLVLDPRGDESAGGTSSLEREARALARVTDPRVVAVFDGGRDGAVVFLAMELVRGRTLKAWLDETAPSPDRVVDVLLAAGRGLEAIHRAGLVHRDIKPSNILLGDDGRVCVGDLGIALAEAIARGSESYAGTPGYMAPEQRARRGADARSDQYAFCVTAWEALTGAGRGATAPPRPLPAALRGALERGLADEPDARWPTLGELLAVLERWRGRHRRRALGAGATLAVAVVVGGVLASRGAATRPDVCAATARELDGTWTASRRAALAAAFAAVPSPVAAGAWTRTDAVLDGWVARWRAARVEACDATVRHTQPVAVRTRREVCLARRRDQLDALLDALAHPDALAAPLAVSAAWALPAPESCLAPLAVVDAAAPQPDAPAVRAVYQQIARAAALRRLGKPADAVTAAAATVTAATATADRGLIAQALTELGQSRTAASEHEPSIEALRRAVHAADRAGLDDVRFAAWAELAIVIGEIRADRVEGALILEQLGALHDRLPPDPRREAMLAERTAAYHRIHGDYAACITHATRAETLRRAHDPDNPLGLADALNLIGVCHERDSRDRQARAVFEQVLELRRRAVGEDHAATATAYNNLASVAHSLGDYATAERDHRRALAIRERVLGPAHRDVAQSHNNLANTLTKKGDPADALVHARAARDIWARSVGPRTVVTATATAVMGHAERALGHLDEAERLYREALAIRLEVRGPNHEDVTRVLGDLARLMVQRGDLAQAIAFADDAWRRDLARGGPAIDLASAEIDRLMIHAAEPRRRAPAVARVRTLCPQLADPDWVVERAACEAFLARDGAPPP